MLPHSLANYTFFATFRISYVLALIEHGSIVALAIMLFIAFNRYSPILCIIGAAARSGEGLIYSYSEINYWGLLKIAGKYPGTGDAEKKSLSDSGLIILDTHDSHFTFGMIFWSIGTLAYSTLIVAHGVIPPIIGWVGIGTGISSLFGYGIKFVKPKFNILIAIGGLSAMAFEAVIGIWLLFFSHITL